MNVHFYNGKEEPEICGWDPNVAREGATTAGLTYPEQIADVVADVVLSELPTYITVTVPGPGLDKLVVAAREQVKRQAAERARLAAVPAALYDFGPAGQQLGMLKGYGMPRRYTPVSQTTLWDEKTGFGWVKPGKDEEQRWIADPLERDSCHIHADNVFRFRLQPGKYRLSISAEPWNAQGVIAVKTAAGGQKATITKAKYVAKFTVDGGSEALEVSVDGQYLLKWISAVGESPTP